MFDREQLAWAAGIFDGEGTVAYRQLDRSPTLVLSVSQTHPEMVERLRALFGVGSITRRPGATSTRKDVWKWAVCNFEHVQYVAAAIWPWLGSVKREQMSTALVAARTNSKRRAYRLARWSA